MDFGQSWTTILLAKLYIKVTLVLQLDGVLPFSTWEDAC